MKHKIIILGLCLLLVGNHSLALQKDGNKDYVMISVMGDVMLDRGVGNLIEVHGPDYPWEKVRFILTESDLCLVNLETSIGNSESAPMEKEYVFKSKSITLQGLVHAGIHGVSLANNHTLDYGQDVFLETLKHLDEANIKYAGGGRNIDEAHEAAIWHINGIKVGFLAFSRVIPDMSWYATPNRAGIASGYDYYSETVSKLINNAKERVDFLIVSLHWGKELEEYPLEKDIEFAKHLIDSGADLIMGHHPHVLQGIEFYKNKPIIYSLGNFIFNSRGYKSNTSMIVNTIINQQGIMDITVIPIVIKHGQPNVAEGLEKEEIIQRLNRLSEQWDTTFTEKGTVTGPIEYISQNRDVSLGEGTAYENVQNTDESKRNTYKKPLILRLIIKIFGYQDTYSSSEEILFLNKGNQSIEFDYGNNILTIHNVGKKSVFQTIFVEAPLRLGGWLLKWEVNPSNKST